MPNGGLLRDPSRLWHDAEFRQATLVQAGCLLIILSLSAYVHFQLQQLKTSSVAVADGVLDEDVAEIDALFVYPVKSGRGVELDSAQMTRKGFKYDRRWAVVRKEGLKRLNLKDEEKITHIIPSFDGDVLRLRVGEASAVKLPNIAVPLEADEATLQSWPLVENIHFYGDYADGREAQLASDYDGEWKDTPSAWVSQLLGYPVYFLQFEPTSSKRMAFPIFKPPHDMSRWDAARQKQLKGPTQIEFQDLYPLLVATRESLAVVNKHVKETISSEKTKVDRQFWSKQDEIALPIQRFRPNIVLRSRKTSEKQLFPGFSEDSWETIWVQSKEGMMPIHLVARCERCLLTTVDPTTAHREPNIPLSYLRSQRKRDAQPGVKRAGPCFGMYSIPQQMDGERGYARIAVGDPVRVRWRPYELDDEVALGTRMKRQAEAAK